MIALAGIFGTTSILFFFATIGANTVREKEDYAAVCIAAMLAVGFIAYLIN